LECAVPPKDDKGTESGCGVKARKEGVIEKIFLYISLSPANNKGKENCGND